MVDQSDVHFNVKISNASAKNHSNNLETPIKLPAMTLMNLAAKDYFSETTKFTNYTNPMIPEEAPNFIFTTMSVKNVPTFLAQ